jgi:Holliday junction DNA helicase RuvB
MREPMINESADDADRVAELALRPKNLGEFVGQLRVRAAKSFAVSSSGT